MAIETCFRECHYHVPRRLAAQSFAPAEFRGWLILRDSAPGAMPLMRLGYDALMMRKRMGIMLHVKITLLRARYFQVMLTSLFRC